MGFQSLTADAVAALRRERDWEFICNEPEVFTCGDLANLMERLADEADRGDASAAERLSLILAPTSAWDNAGMDALLGQGCYEAVKDLQRRLFP